MERIKAKAVVKVQTEFGRYCLYEIKGLREGEILEGMYDPKNKAFDFYWKGEGAMLWIGQNGELIK